MSINKFVVIVIIIFLFYSNVFVLNTLYSVRQEKDILYNELENNYINSFDVLNMSSRQMDVVNKYDSFKSYLLSDSVLFEDFLFVYRYTNSICESCKKRDFDILKLFANKFGEDNILVVSSESDNRENRIRLSVDLKGIRYVMLPDSVWAMPISKKTNTVLPFFALINRSLDIEVVIFSDMTTLVKSFIDNFESKD